MTEETPTDIPSETAQVPAVATNGGTEAPAVAVAAEVPVPAVVDGSA
eukprot:CAMPEP_0181334648 /NCGR_PEP_ID=MMETSP1101-20121128/26384_1 /TAXON_ID=46948 /ORGANISM="Rhodomonas abbreviata, Strain Caron Lab Isolate" /LENGTH=46 /DNA_ID= /DNA_START= /DNA_END= /DNA_ORIENTATION=